VIGSWGGHGPSEAQNVDIRNIQGYRDVDSVNMKYPSYQRRALDESWDAIVIGSGIGRLATALLLSLPAGKRVLVLESHYTAGGYTHVFHRPAPLDGHL